LSLDTKYRPIRYEDVLGQESTIKILRRFVAEKRGFRQSYLFSGPFGSGKTTLGRIHARTLLCETPSPSGDPCDQCSSCRSLLDLGTSMNFTEVDAATNSGKAEIQRIVEEIQYDTFSGNRHLYLFDEAHQLSPSALDAMLKPMEENVPGSEDKRLMCIFCTTEPERMRLTILSRCAPAFVIQTVSPALIAVRLEKICKAEGIAYDPAMLLLISEMTECHIRDALKAIEGVSMLGAVNKENVTSYLRLDLNSAYLDILENLGPGRDLGVAVQAAKKLLERSSPVTCYEKLAELSMLAYQVFLGATSPPVYLDPQRMTALGQAQQSNLLNFSSRFAGRPGRPSASMLFCDLGNLHHGVAVAGDRPVVIMTTSAPTVSVQAASFSQMAIPTTPPPVQKVPELSTVSVQQATSFGKLQQQPPLNYNDTVVANPRARASNQNLLMHTAPVKPRDGVLECSNIEFCRLLALNILEMDGAGGSARRVDLDSHRAFPSGGAEG